MTERLNCFPPIAEPDAKVLILGSFPGEMSLAKQQYYAHPRNSFWAIMTHLFAFEGSLQYHLKVKRLTSNRIALWDVLEQCRRSGSLDTAIQRDSIVVNDFGRLFEQCRKIRAVFFNGRRAEQEFKRHVTPGFTPKARSLNLVRLPSTSPALATLSFEQKLTAWSQIKSFLEK